MLYKQATSWTVGLGGLLPLLLVLLVTTHPAKGFSPLPPVVQVHRQQQQRSNRSSSSSRLNYGRLSTDSWNPVQIWKENFVQDPDASLETREAFAKQQYDTNLFVLAAIPPILAFCCYGQVAHALAYWLNMLGFSGSNVDDNAFATDLLRPTLNGVVVPATGVGLGTLFATTVNVLWNRQLQLRATINKEVCELRLLRRALFGCYGTAQHSQRRATSLGLLRQYTQTLRGETSTIECIERLEQTQKSGGGISMNELDELAELLHGVDGAAASRESSVAKASDLLVSLVGHRSERVATTLSGFPRIHWFLMDVLYLCIILSFLVDSNQEVNQYLNSVQLQVLFAILASIGSGAAMLLKDLEDPFQGSFCINLASKQLTSLEELLQADVDEACEESQQVGRPALIFSNGNKTDDDNNTRRQRPNYNAPNTIYFHLLTGPLGANVRLLGDLVAWTVRKVTKSWRALWPRRKRTRGRDYNGMRPSTNSDFL